MLIRPIITFLFIGLFSVLGLTAQVTPPKIVAVGNQVYCPLSQINIVTDFNVIDNHNTQINALFIQISSGYRNGQDRLELSNQSSHPNIVATWSARQGKLTLGSPTNVPIDYSDMIAAVKDVVFESNSAAVSGEKHFSFTLGAANYLPSTGHYYEYVAHVGITWKDAFNAAASRNYYGLQGYLATITSYDEAKLSGEQAAGAGWIGGSDEAVEGEWKWMSGPEAGTVFWNGDVSGSSPNFANWNSQEPNNLYDEDYAHVTSPNVGTLGSWNDLSNTGAASGDYQPKGYVVEYGGMPGDPIVDISASTMVFVPEIESVTNGSHCGPGQIDLQATVSQGGTLLWFDSEQSTTPIHTGNQFQTPLLNQTATYYVLASDGTCTEGTRHEITASIYEIPQINPSHILENCDEDGTPDGITDFNLHEADAFLTLGNSNLTVSYYLSQQDADQANNPVTPSPFSNATASTVFARVENSDGCYELATVELEVSTTSLPSNYLKSMALCDTDDVNDGITAFDLSIMAQDIIDDLPQQDLTVHFYHNLQDAQLEQNEINQANYRSTTTYNELLYVRVESLTNGSCYGIGPHAELTVHPRPEFKVIPNATVCRNRPPIMLETFAPDGQYQYRWENAQGQVLGTGPMLEVSLPGEYYVIATSPQHCDSFTRTISVLESEIAQFTREQIAVTDNSENNTIRIFEDQLGIGDYEYALDNGMFQDNPLFEGVLAGMHLVTARDKHGCGEVTVEVSIIGYPKFFTPNNDGYNDTWQVDGILAQPNSKVYIFDRLGRLIAQIATNGEGWDGTHNNKPLPSSDYWYLAELEDGRIHRGHFSLIRESRL